MKTVYLTGHRNFNNRGCEAIVRSTIKLLKQHDKALKFIVPSNNINEDINRFIINYYLKKFLQTGSK